MILAGYLMHTLVRTVRGNTSPTQRDTHAHIKQRISRTRADSHELVSSALPESNIV